MFRFNQAENQVESHSHESVSITVLGHCLSGVVCDTPFFSSLKLSISFCIIKQHRFKFSK